jgi:hypothetical protein
VPAKRQDERAVGDGFDVMLETPLEEEKLSCAEVGEPLREVQTHMP